MKSETMVPIEHNSVVFNLRFFAKEAQIKPVDIGFSCIVGDKAIRVYPNRLVEIADLEFIRADDVDGPGAGSHPVAYTERLSWTTQYPEGLDLDSIMASLDFAFMSAGLPSLFFITNLSIGDFESIEEKRIASIKAFHVLYPGVNPCMTELNGTLFVYGRDLFEQFTMDE